MPDVDAAAVAVATLAVFVLSFGYYAVFARQLAAVSPAAAAADDRPPLWKLGVELLRSLVVAAVVAGLAAEGAIDDWVGGLALGLALWVGFPLVLWTGALLWEATPRPLAALHAGDWLVKLLVVGVIVSAWG